MGHNIGLSSCYYKPTEKEVLEDYLKAVELLTINNSNILHAKIVSLEEKQGDYASMKIQHEQQMKAMREEMEMRFQNIVDRIDFKRIS